MNPIATPPPQSTLTIPGLKVLTVDNVTNLLVFALEGGSNYWCAFPDASVKRVREATPDMQSLSFCERLLAALAKGVQVDVVDVESDSDDDVLGTLTEASWAKAEELMITHHRAHLGDVLSENDDATTGDVFLQLAALGELVYG